MLLHTKRRVGAFEQKKKHKIKMQEQASWMKDFK